jgi:hypothetical protein
VLLHGTASAQGEVDRLQTLAAAELAYPSSEVPPLFSPGSASSRFAQEVENRAWSAEMEARIVLEIDKARDGGLLLRRSDVACRSTTCAILLVHATPGSAVNDLTNVLRDSLGFGGLSVASREVPLVRNGTAWFILGHTEIVLAKR